MADDITLTVRVRDMTRGDFNQIRQRMHGMDGDIRRLGQASQGATAQAARMGREIQRLDNRLGHMHRTGRIANEEMTHMRRTMSLLGRDLRQAARDGHLTEDQFSSLSRQLERTRLDFDYLARDIDRHSARANRAAREEQRRQADAQRMGQIRARAQREDEQRTRRMGQVQVQALRENERRDAARQRQLQRMGQLQARALREEAQRVQRLGQVQARALREDEERTQRAGRLHARALREDEERAQRLGRIHAQALRMDQQRDAAARRSAAQAQQRSVARLAGLGGADRDLTLRFRAMGEDDVRRMSRGFDELQRTVGALSGSTARARRNVSTLNGDLRVMARALQDADDAGSLSRREFNALSNGLRVAVRDMRMLRGSTDMSRSTLRGMRREVAGLRAQLTLLGNEGTRVRRLDASLLLLQRRMRDNRHGAGLLRRSMSRVGEGMVGGLRGGVLGTAALIGLMGKLGDKIKMNKRWTMILVAALLLIGPAAQALGALLVTALGGAFIALGALALKNSTLVKSAFQDMKSTVASSVRQAAQPMEDDLVAGIQNVGIAVARMQPMLTAAFGATGPLIRDFAGAFTDLAGMSMPGILTALQEMGPVMEGFRIAMGQLGKGFGDMFAAMTAGGGAEALRDVWITLGRELANLLVGIGEFINMATQSGTATMLLVGVFRSLSGILNIVETGLAVVDTMFGDLFMHINQNVMAFDNLGASTSSFNTGFVEAGQSVKSLKEQLKETNKEIADIKKNQDFAKSLGPSGEDFYLNKYDSTDQDLANAQAKRKGLLAAIAEAEDGAAAATARHAASVTDLIAKITALNEQNRSNLDARANQERVIDEAAKNASKYSSALKMVKGQLDLSNESGREAYGWLSQIAAATKESTDAAIKSNAPWEQVRKQWKQGYDEVVRLGDGMGLTKAQARTLADQIVGIPDKEIFLQARTEQAIADFNGVIAAMKASPDEKTITVRTLTADSISALEKLGFVVEQLPDGSFTVTAETGTARDNIGKVKAARDGLKGKSITMSAKDASTGVIQAIKELIATLQGKTITVTTIRRTVYEEFFNPQSTAGSLADALRRQSKNARGGATGGLAENLKGYADGGSIAGEVLEGPGTKKSDSLLARLSRGEFVMRASAVDKYGPGFMKMVNEGRLRIPGFAKGGSVRGEARQAIKPIKAATSGATEKSLLRLMNQIIKGSIKMATALKSVTSALDKAKSRLSSLRSEAKSLSDSVRTRTITPVTEGVEAGKPVSVATLMGRLRVGRDKATAFAGALKRLRKRGLSKGLLRQVAEAGVDGGGLETAGALLRASGSELKSINSFYGQMSRAGSSAGRTTADALFGKQIRAQEKLVKALNELSTALKKATSKKRKATGGIIGAASGGLRGGLVEVGEQGPELVRLPFGSSVYSNPDSRRIAGMGGGSFGGPMVLQVFIGEKKVDEIVLDSNRRTVRTRGGNVQAIFSQR